MAEKDFTNSDNLIKCKRLFVGGLYNGVSENDLSLKFKPFGNVKDLEIICRHDSGSGDHIKTFAYLNIDMTEKNFRKCLTTYNKCNWKGHVLKVEVAKEDYLTRLQKENTVNISFDQTKESQDVIADNDIKSAVPGTPVPNKQNWVIGKFGRALPIMFLRRKDGRKVAKFDPSKTVHCLKRLSENNNRQNHSVHNLTWNLDHSDPILDRDSTNTVPVKRPLQETESNSHMAKDKIRTKKRHSNFEDVECIGSVKSVTADSNGDYVYDQTKGGKIGLLNSGNFIEKNNHYDESISFPSSNQSFNDDETSETSHVANDSKMSDEESCCFDECSTFLNVESHLGNKQSTSGQYQPSAAAGSQSKHKQEISNKVRLETLEERKEVLKTQKQVVKNALEKMDAGFVNRENHIVFDNNENQTDEKNRNLTNGEKKITGSQALAWLGMDSSSDEDGSNKKVDDFLGKEHFDGKSGEKLMKLQHKFGHDERFKMDERFLESDDEMELMSKTSVIKEDSLDDELKEEKRLSLKVLQDVLGTNSVFVEENEDARNVYRDSVDTHYDPTRKDHAKFEEEIKRPESPVQNNEDNVAEEVPAANEHVATQEKFYSVSDSLKGFFTNKDKKNSTFSFFPEVDEKKDNLDSVAETSTITGWKAPVKTSQPLPYDSSASESEDDIEQSTSDPTSSTVNMKKCLFYRTDDQGMMDALQAESSNFMRKESVESLTRYWVGVRQKITQSYKQKRKDALRRQKRASYRRTEQ